MNSYNRLVVVLTFFFIFFSNVFGMCFFIYVSFRAVVSVFEPFCPVDTVLLFTVFYSIRYDTIRYQMLF